MRSEFAADLSSLTPGDVDKNQCTRKLLLQIDQMSLRGEGQMVREGDDKGISEALNR